MMMGKICHQGNLEKFDFNDKRVVLCTALREQNVMPSPGTSQGVTPPPVTYPFSDSRQLYYISENQFTLNMLYVKRLNDYKCCNHTLVGTSVHCSQSMVILTRKTRALHNCFQGLVADQSFQSRYRCNEVQDFCEYREQIEDAMHTVVTTTQKSRSCELQKR